MYQHNANSNITCRKLGSSYWGNVTWATTTRMSPRSGLRAPGSSPGAPTTCMQERPSKHSGYCTTADSQATRMIIIANLSQTCFTEEDRTA